MKKISLRVRIDKQPIGKILAVDVTVEEPKEVHLLVQTQLSRQVEVFVECSDDVPREPSEHLFANEIGVSPMYSV